MIRKRKIPEKLWTASGIFTFLETFITIDIYVLAHILLYVKFFENIL